MTSTAEARRAHLMLHGCVALWGFTAILGKLITLSATALVVWRMLLVTAMLMMIPRAWRGLRELTGRQRWIFGGIGCVIALHWLAFYGSIKLANASVAVACLALGAIFAAILEPWITRRPHDRSELLLGVLAIPGVILLVGGVPLDMRLGIAVGVIAALLSALFGSLNKRLVSVGEPATVTLIEMGVGTVFVAITAVVVFGPAETLPRPSLADFFWLLVLAGACTVLPFLWWLRALHHVSAFGTQVALNLEPVYAIVIAALLFREYAELTPRFYLGVAIILGTVFLQPRLASALRTRRVDSR